MATRCVAAGVGVGVGVLAAGGAGLEADDATGAAVTGALVAGPDVASAGAGVAGLAGTIVAGAALAIVVAGDAPAARGADVTAALDGVGEAVDDPSVCVQLASATAAATASQRDDAEERRR
jgi:hypothetical protein